MNNFLIFRILCLKHYHIFRMSAFVIRHLMYMLLNEKKCDRENKKLNRNAHVFNPIQCGAAPPPHHHHHHQQKFWSSQYC